MTQKGEESSLLCDLTKYLLNSACMDEGWKNIEPLSVSVGVKNSFFKQKPINKPDYKTID